jgi:hypothetical protein
MINVIDFMLQKDHYNNISDSNIKTLHRNIIKIHATEEKDNQYNNNHQFRKINARNQKIKMSQYRMKLWLRINMRMITEY